jgi:hypothetical protein
MIQDNFLFWSLKWPGYELGDVDTEVEFAAASKHDSQGNPVEFDLHEYERLFLLIPEDDPSGNPGYIDIVDYKAREIYEIKSVKSAPRGRKELLWYLTALNTRLPNAGSAIHWYAGTRTYPEGVRTIGPWPEYPYGLFVDVVAWIDRGVILYSYKINKQRAVAASFLVPGGIAILDWLRSRGRKPKPGGIGVPQPGKAFGLGGICIIPDPTSIFPSPFDDIPETAPPSFLPDDGSTSVPPPYLPPATDPDASRYA